MIVAYNLPSSVTMGNELLLSGPLMCRIFRANITTWTDPAIQAANPLMAWNLAVMPDGVTPRPIQVQQLTNNYASAQVWTSYCAKIDPVFKATIPVSGNPKLPWSSFGTPVLFYPNVDSANSALKDSPWTIAIMPLSNARFLGQSVAAFINAGGQVVHPNTVSMSLNLFELATNGYPAGSLSFDLTNPATAQAWPMMSISYLWLDAASARTTCKTKQLMIDFLLWFLQSSVVAQIGTNLYSVVFPSVLVDQLHLIDRLQSEVSCDGSMALTSSTTSHTYIASNALGVGILTMLATFYREVDPTVNYAIRTVSETLSVARLLTGETPLALVDPRSLSTDDTQIIQDANAKLLPVFLTGVVPIFNLPTAVVALYTSNAALDTPDPSLPALYPLRIDLESLAAIFLGDIDSWLDPQLVALNPQLPTWFTASGAKTNLTVLVGASSGSDPAMASRLLFQAITQSQTALLPRHAYTQSILGSALGLNPFLQVVANNPSRVAMIDTEARLTFKLATKPGAVSYRLVGQVTDIKSEFQFVQRNSKGVVETVAPQVSSMGSCGSEILAMPSDSSLVPEAITRILDPATQKSMVSVTSPTPGCYPLATVLSFVVQPEFLGGTSGSKCGVALHALEFMHYVQSQDVLGAPMHSLGLVRLADWGLMREVTEFVLASTSCDGQALVFMQPNVFSIGGAMRGAAVGIVSIFLVGLCISGLAIGLNRGHRVLTRDSTAAFQIVLLSGMALFIAALLPWTEAPSAGSCKSLVWLVCLGFTMMYAPQVASLWQAWRFAGMNAAESKGVRILPQTGLTLPATLSCGVLLAIDLLLIGLWQSTSPLRPQEFSRSTSLSQDVFTHCSIDTSNSAAWAFVVVILISKGALILVGAILALYGSMQRLSNDAHLSRRRSFVATLTAKRQRRSLYLLVAVSVVIFASLVATSAVQSTLILLIALFLILNVAGSWALIFFPRFHALLSADGGLSAEEAEMSSRSSGSKSGGSQNLSNLSVGISTTALAAMDAKKLQAYLQTLQAQTQFASRELLSRTKDGHGSGGGSFLEESLLSSEGHAVTGPRLRQVAAKPGATTAGAAAGRSTASTVASSPVLSTVGSRDRDRTEPAAAAVLSSYGSGVVSTVVGSRPEPALLTSYGSSTASSVYPGSTAHPHPGSPMSVAPPSMQRAESTTTGMPSSRAVAASAAATPLESPTVAAIRARAALRIHTSNSQSTAKDGSSPVRGPVGGGSGTPTATHVPQSGSPQ